ncbi:MAG: glycoside hydrolase domain-containing protein [Thermoguttaceae bacterium]|jgi:hypothetical protein
MKNITRKTPAVALVFLLGILGTLAVPCVAADAPPPTVRVPPCAKPPVIDGVISPGEWDGAFQGCVMLQTYAAPGMLGHPKAHYWFTYDRDRIYIAMQMQLPPDGQLVGKRRRTGVTVYSDDHIELWVNPARLHAAQEDSTYYQFGGNSAGSMHTFMHNPRTPGWMTYRGDRQFQNTVKDGWWTMEFSVKAEDLEKADLLDGTTWGVNFCRYWFNPPEESAWPNCFNWYDPLKYARIVLDRNAPVIQMLGSGNPGGGKPGFECSLFNPTNKKLDLVAVMRVEDPAKTVKPVEARQNISLSPGQREKVTLQADWAVGDRKDACSTEVTSADGKIMYFSEQHQFDKTNVPQVAWTVLPPKKEEVIFKPCFYPGFSRVRCLADVSALKNASAIQKATVAVKDASGKDLARGVIDRFEEGEGETILQLPSPLAEGKYTVRLTVPSMAPVEKSFDKKRFPFEGNTLGISDKVLYPWTPMKCQGTGKKGQVQVWNRTFTLGEDGFFKQVRSGKIELLARPMHFAGKSGGSELTWKGEGVKFGKTTESASDFSGGCSSEKVRVRVDCHSEFDGMFKYTVTLDPAGDGKVDGLDLVVPLKEEHAWLLHACSDGCRTNKSLFTPRGEGRVFDSTQVSQFMLTGTFIPYLWLGDDRGGLCWWADSEKGWVRAADKKEPAIEVRRTKGEVRMVFHLIAKPFRLKEPRTLVFAFNASPVRPRPAWARSWTMHSSKKDGFLSGPYLNFWGSSCWAMFGKDVTDDPDDPKQKMPYTYARLRPISDEADAWLKATMAKLREAGTTALLYTDLLSRAVDRGDEVRHYASEWDRYNAPWPQDETRGWRSNAQIVANMTRSRVDYDLWCLKHDLRLGAEAYVMDETQCSGQLNPGADLGFKDEEGNWEAETSLFAMREFFKRVYTMLQEAGIREPVISAHSTSTMYVGPYAFQTRPTDLELVSPDLARGQFFGIGEAYSMANVMARQHGFAGTAQMCMKSESGQPGTDWLIDFWTGNPHPTRTWQGSALLFDVRPGGGMDPVESPILDCALGHFGFGDPEVQFVPYWRAGDLQSMRPDCLRVSLYRNKGQALVVIYNDSPNDVIAHWKPTAQFGMPSFATPQIMLPEQMLGDKTKLAFRYAYPQAKDPEGYWGIFVPRYDYRLVLVPASPTWGAEEDWGPIDPKLFERNLKK